MDSARYKAATLTNDPVKQIEIIAKSGYATDPGYRDKILAVANQFD